jgi:N6-L-threonylcarbamoyladenine synthase
VILAIETSCDETCAAVVQGAEVRSNIVSSQAALHGRFGGVVPEIASRRHLELVGPVVREALADAGASFADLRAIAVTAGPGLIGALLVGVSAAKAYAYAAAKPLIPVDHLHGHIASLFIGPEPLEPPFLCLLASGGHTLLLDVHDHVRSTVLGRSLDDAAGEAFDKGARLLGLGYPGGPAIEAAAAGGDPEAVALPVAMAGREGLDFSFSGLKTALRTRLRDERHDLADLAASYQAAIVASLVSRTLRALEQSGARRLGVVGGVAANTLLRSTLQTECARRDIELRCAPLVYCGDNAAMIGAAAEHLEPIAFPDYLQIDAHARANVVAQSL